MSTTACTALAEGSDECRLPPPLEIYVKKGRCQTETLENLKKSRNFYRNTPFAGRMDFSRRGVIQGGGKARTTRIDLLPWAMMGIPFGVRRFIADLCINNSS